MDTKDETPRAKREGEDNHAGEEKPVHKIHPIIEKVLNSVMERSDHTAFIPEDMVHKLQIELERYFYDPSLGWAVIDLLNLAGELDKNNMKEAATSVVIIVAHASDALARQQKEDPELLRKSLLNPGE